MSSSKFISVIITAYQRRDYLINAVKSAINQTVSNDKYEIILVKDFDLSEIDNIILPNFEVIKANGKIGEFLKIAIQKSRGDIICFLDDDDEFYPDKLETIFRLFNENKSVGYIHNAFEFINENGQLITHRKKISKRFDLYVPNSMKEKYLFKVENLGGTVNLSSVSIRRELIEPHLNLLSIVIASTDGWFYCFALKSNFDLYISNKLLNKYRIHSNQSISRDLHTFVSTNEKMSSTMLEIHKFLENTKFVGLGEESLFYWNIRNKFSKDKNAIQIMDAFYSLKYFILTHSISFLVLLMAIICRKIFKISLYEIKYRDGII